MNHNGNIKIGDITCQKALALAALYNASHPQGMGFLHFDPKPMVVEEAEALLREDSYFDYLKGRVMKLDFGKDELATRLYDRDNGDGAAMRAIQEAMESVNYGHDPIRMPKAE